MKHNYFYPALSELKGKVLEIGFGEGENLKHYPSNCQIYALEKEDKKIENIKDKDPNVKFFEGKAENLPFENNFFDVVVVSLVLCSVDSIEKAIKEIERIIKPDGKFILLEHVRSENRVVGKLQDIITTPYSWIDNNCHLNRNPLLFINKNIFNLSIEAQVSYFLGSRLVFAKCQIRSKLGGMS